jgi:hypothetical protein
MIKPALNSSVMYQFGKIANSNIDYQNNSRTQRITEKMPSYYSSLYAPRTEFSGSIHSDYENAEKQSKFLANPQIDWRQIVKPIKIQFWMLMEQLRATNPQKVSTFYMKIKLKMKRGLTNI